MVNADIQFIQKLEINESQLQDMMNGNAQAIMNNVVYTIPVVFHVIHLGESVGTGSNISDAQLMQALDDLNYDFRDIGGAGTDVEIEFCLAQRAPDGSPSTGINRVNGYGVGDYESIGMATGGNETALKALSIWPNRDYLNIWVVYDIIGGFGMAPPNGFATLPGAPSNVDGIVLRADATGVSSYSHVITHEVGHFFALYHTFEGSVGSTCAPNTDCHLQGDRICDTPHHLQPSGGCVTTGTTCDMVTSIAEVAHNYMNYTDNSCRDRFTAEQVMRMRTVLMTLRNTLTYSLGCEPGCTSVIADFIEPSAIPYLDPYTFVNTTSGGSFSYSWLVDGVEYDTTTNFIIPFYIPGLYDVCLDATDTSGCTNRKCDSVSVYFTCSLPSDPCEKIINGDFEYIEPTSNDNERIDSDVCGWRRTESSPFYCIGPDNNAIGLLFHWQYFNPIPSYDFERVTSRLPVDLDSNSICKISFDYIVAGSNLDAIIISLSPDPFVDQPLTNVNSTTIAQVVNPITDYTPQNNNECYNSTFTFHHHEEYFYYNGDEGAYLNISGERLNQDSLISYLFIDNISINCCPPTACIPEPGFVDTLIGCTATFTGSNTGDPGDYLWDFGDGSIDTGSIVTHQFLWGDTFTVCLTIRCPDSETTQTICHDIIIPDSCDNCFPLANPITASRCDTTESWVANFCIRVPKGFKACKDNKLFVSSPEVAITVLNYQIDVSNSLYELVCVAIKLISPTGYNFEANGATGYISLCSDGEIPMICRYFEIDPFVCDDCGTPISNTAICNDPNLNDNIRIYRGSISVTLTSTTDYVQVVSTESIFEVNPTSVTKIGGNFTIPYSFITTNHNLANFQVILNFVNTSDGTRTCVPVNITLPVCDALPTNCGLEWSVKNMACSGSDGGNLVIFNFNMSVNVGNLELCNGGLFGTVDGGKVYILTPSPTSSGGVFTFNVDMVIPCDSFVSGEIYNMRLYLCTEEGDLECLLFPFRLFCDDCTGIGFRAEPVLNQKNKTADQYWIVPNPATDRLNIFTTGRDPEKRQEARLFNQLGRLVKSADLSSDSTEIDVSPYSPGIYYLVISNNGTLVKSEKVIIMR